jgi:hypothetical protein
VAAPAEGDDPEPGTADRTGSTPSIPAQHSNGFAWASRLIASASGRLNRWITDS